MTTTHTTTDTQHDGRHRAPVLRISGVGKSFGGIPVLRDVSLSIDGGSTLALMGANGSGKSTLIKVLAGFHVPDPGSSAEFMGQPFDLEQGSASRPHGMHFIHQDLGLVAELVAGPAHRDDEPCAGAEVVNHVACMQSLSQLAPVGQVGLGDLFALQHVHGRGPYA